MIIGIGTDICEINRIQPGEGFANKILSESEQEVLKAKKNKQVYLAKRFAAKEAISKAFGCGIGSKLSFKDISILNNEAGAPYVEISETAKSKLVDFSSIHISISDEKNYAIAYVIVEKI
ncbi:MAG TPA: holo-ACP synthase [Alphaproteobacteria bacterium]|nr:holo-ACP synthase [Alphaproteobacteria bacterium]